MAAAFSELVRSMIPVVAGVQALKGIFGSTGHYFTAAYATLSVTSKELRAQGMEQRHQAIEAFKRGELTLAMLMREIEKIKESRHLRAAQVVLAEKVEQAGSRNLSLFKAMLIVLGDMALRQHELNQDLINANSSFMVRQRLMYDTLMTQVKLGASFQQTTEAAKALVVHGLEARKNFSALLKTTLELNEGLGLSLQTAAELAATVENRLGGSFEKVADTMATLVNNTALTADEAGRLANNLARVMETIRPGVAATALPEVLELVGHYESAIKRLGGQAGTVEQLLARLTTPEGMAGAGMLGVTSPAFIQSKEGARQVLETFTTMMEKMVGNAQTWQGRMQLGILAEQFGMTADQARMLMEAQKRLGQEVGKDITVHERFKQQIAATGQGMLRLGNTLLGLLSGALYPVVRALNIVINTINEFIEGVLKYKGVAVGAMIAVGVGTVALVWRLRHLAMAFIEVMLAARAAEIAARAQARASLVRQLPLPLGGPGSGSAAGTVGRILGPIVTAVSTLNLGLGRWIGSMTAYARHPSTILEGFRLFTFPLAGMTRSLVTGLGNIARSISAMGLMRTLSGIWSALILPGQRFPSFEGFRALLGRIAASFSGTGGWLAVIMRPLALIVRAIALLATPLGLIVALVGAVVGVCWWLRKGQQKAEEQARIANDARFIATRTGIQRGQAVFYDEIRKAQLSFVKGDFMQHFNRLVELRTGDLPEAQRYAERRKAYRELLKAGEDAMYTATMFQRPQDVTPESQAYIQQTQELLEQIRNILQEGNVGQRADAQKAIERFDRDSLQLRHDSLRKNNVPVLKYPLKTEFKTHP